MRKFAFFALSFGLSFLLFCSAFLAVIVVSGARLIEKDVAYNSVAERSVENTGSTNILLLYCEPKDNRVAAALLEISGSDFSTTARPLTVSKEAENFAYNDQVNTFAETVSIQNDLKLQSFIKFDSESFAKISDRLNGVVYNNEGIEQLLTGTQAAEIMDSQLLCLAGCQFVETMKKKDILTEFKNIANITENNLSLADVLVALKEVEK